jgi:hypothetical protein
MTRTGTLLLLTLAMACPASAHTVVIEGGKVHLRGELVNGGCAVAPDSQNMRIDMGQYRTNSFSGVGSFSTVNVPFTVRLLDCSVDVSRTVGIQFQGPHPQKILRSFWRHRDQVKRLSAAALGWRSLTSSSVRLSQMPRPSAGCRSIPASWRSILAPAIGLFPNTSSQAKFSRMSGLR